MKYEYCVFDECITKTEMKKPIKNGNVLAPKRPVWKTRQHDYSNNKTNEDITHTKATKIKSVRAN